ncbi:hypothetical protein [Parabacteroides gordonii]|mgnify:CR=1 FL=1|jgi:predicted nucleic acid-binding protein|uniref:hypothetical protein n=1 Tax=Parabacteroides gordonii TaxID=574930 RepID=UPI0024204B7E|nr:hypothetical protein [Parabacteroides gordonii]
MKHYLLDTNICTFFLKGKYDLFTKINKIGWEGATAIQAKITLVTENLKHFNRIPNIKVENWINR